ncbi:50S ribosomal protein L13 [Candidatus Parcubacteria bacterium]|nr:MAG: 50S ribosomal protein L13 [Candidatus Parcubacteria bacterium]
MERNTHQIDAKGMIAGRLASKIAVLLQGKHKTTYQPNVDGGDIVEVSNVDKLKFSGKKLEQKLYHRTSGYPGGIKTDSLKKRMAENPGKLFHDMVKDMLPKNKLRATMIKRLIIK